VCLCARTRACLEMSRDGLVSPHGEQVNPFLYRRKTVDWCKAKGIAVQAYRALRDGKAFEHPTVVSVAAKHGKTPAQVLGRWCVQKGVIYIPKSVKEERMRENLAVFDWSLDAGDVEQLDALTTADNLETFKALYIKCVTRDTPIAGSQEAADMTRKSFTVE
jgi:diketogulonate reductase-like aldo/keto reductase